MIFPNHYQALAPTLYADDTCVFYQHEDVKKFENVSNKEFSSLYQWLIDNKLSIHVRENKTKSMLFSKTKSLREINMSFADHSIKQHEKVEYVGFQLDFKLIGEAKSLKFLKKENAKLNFLYRKSRYLTPACRRLYIMS